MKLCFHLPGLLLDSPKPPSLPHHPPLHIHTHSLGETQLLPQSFCTGSRLAELTVGALVAAQGGSCMRLQVPSVSEICYTSQGPLFRV